ncbi:hypothetical protein [Streptomyces pimonensis]|uniref:hypothetical protein n=1 Tax=Streptomyces pimonensis TaxID=2860288 RepID=UPI003527A41B
MLIAAGAASLAHGPDAVAARGVAELYGLPAAAEQRLPPVPHGRPARVHVLRRGAVVFAGGRRTRPVRLRAVAVGPVRPAGRGAVSGRGAAQVLLVVRSADVPERCSLHTAKECEDPPVPKSNNALPYQTS